MKLRRIPQPRGCRTDWRRWGRAARAAAGYGTSAASHGGPRRTELRNVRGATSELRGGPPPDLQVAPPQVGVDAEIHSRSRSPKVALPERGQWRDGSVQPPSCWHTLAETASVRPPRGGHRWCGRTRLPRLWMGDPHAEVTDPVGELGCRGSADAAAGAAAMV